MVSHHEANDPKKTAESNKTVDKHMLQLDQDSYNDDDNDGIDFNQCCNSCDLAALHYLAMGRLFFVKFIRLTANGMEHTASTFTTLKAENLT